MTENDSSSDTSGDSANVLEIKMCKCSRAPWRQHQRNCHFCNREANKRYQKRLKRDADAFKEIAAKVRSI